MAVYNFSWSELTIEKVVNLYLYGAINKPRDYEERLRSETDYADKNIVRIARFLGSCQKRWFGVFSHSYSKSAKLWCPMG